MTAIKSGAPTMLKKPSWDLVMPPANTQRKPHQRHTRTGIYSTDITACGTPSTGHQALDKDPAADTQGMHCATASVTQCKYTQ